MNYMKRLEQAFHHAPILPITSNTKYVFFSDCHRGTGTNNDNFLKNANCYFAALQYYYQRGFCYIEVGDGDELWENCCLTDILEIHNDVFQLLSLFHRNRRLYMLYGNHDMDKKKEKPLFENFQFYEGLILRSENQSINLYVTHGHQADLWNSVFWQLTRFLVRYLWAPLEYFGVSDPTSAAKNNTKKEKLEKKYLSYAQNFDGQILTGHTHRPTLGNEASPYYNCGSCVHPKAITCIELCGNNISLIKWHSSTEKSGHFGNIYDQRPPTYPIYVKREILGIERI